MTKHKVDIKRLLRAIDEGDTTFINALTDDELKQINPFVIMHWLMSTSDHTHAILINEALNIPFTTLSLDIKRFLRVAMACRPVKTQRYRWLCKFPKKSTSMPVSISALTGYYGIGEDDARKSLDRYDLEDILCISGDLGYEDAEIKAIRKEWRNV